MSAMNEIHAYFAKTRLEFLPEDLRFLSELLADMGSTRRKEYLKEYHLVWHKAMHAEPINIKKQNKGRFAANVWIRELILDEKKRAAISSPTAGACYADSGTFTRSIVAGTYSYPIAITQ